MTQSGMRSLGGSNCVVWAVWWGGFALPAVREISIAAAKALETSARCREAQRQRGEERRGDKRAARGAKAGWG